MKPRVAISAGDPSGIGPEVVAKALRDRRVKRALDPLVFGDLSLLDPRVPVSVLEWVDRRPGQPTLAGGRAQLDYVEAAIGAVKDGKADAICTAPVSKEAISRSGIPFMGHTEYLAWAFGCQVMMLMDGPRLKVALATNHLPIAEVPRALRREKLVAQLALLHRTMKKPRIAVCGLNPHAGEGGLLGREELEIIAPAIADAQKKGVRCKGPFGADGLFAHGAKGFDVVLAMFHDQGLIAAKSLDFAQTVNVTLGLPVPRTSPDHGVAYDIAGKGKADPEPMVQALLKAAQLAKDR